MNEIEWLDLDIILDVQAEQLALFGGADGVRDQGLLESAMARPVNKHGCGETSLAARAAAYAFGIARNHPFVDGNKRTAFVAAELFLMLNGHELAADDAACVLTMLAVASGDMGEDAFAAWIRSHLQPR